MSVAGPNQAVLGNIAHYRDRSQTFCAMATNVAEMDKIIARKEKMVAAVQTNVAQTTPTSIKSHVGEKLHVTGGGLVEQIDGAMSSFKHVDEIFPATIMGLVAQNGDTTSSFKHVDKQIPL